MTEGEKAAVGVNNALKPAAKKVKVDHVPRKVVTRDSIPFATICVLVPRGHRPRIDGSVFV